MPFDYTDRTSAVTMKWLRAALSEKFGEDVSDQIPSFDWTSDAVVSPKLLDIAAQKWNALVPISTGSRVFTNVGADSFRIPARVRSITIDAVGAGGGGGSGSVGGGGSSGAGARSLSLDIAPSSLITVNVGGGGAVGAKGGDTTITITPKSGDPQTLTYPGGLPGSSSGSAGSSAGQGSAVGSAGGSKQVQTGGGYYNNSVGSSIAQYSTLSAAQSAYRNNTTSRPASQTSSKPATHYIGSGTITLSGYTAGSVYRSIRINEMGSPMIDVLDPHDLLYRYGSVDIPSAKILTYRTWLSSAGPPPSSWLASQNVTGKSYIAVFSNLTKATGYNSNFTLTLYNIVPRTGSGYLVYPITSSYVSPTYRTENTPGTGGASLISGYGGGGGGGKAGQNGYINIRW